ncbi:MAG: RNA polymerase sigma factor [Armatimonadetes bacterium]|nr:RNA polymerase sigma factor [Armatimonadota bacterium]
MSSTEVAWQSVGSSVSMLEPPDLDARDVRMSLGGDPDSFERLVRRHQAAIGRLMWRFARNAADQDELTQEVFVTAWTALRTWRGTGSFERWLRRIAVRVGYAYWRRRGKDAARLEFAETVDELVDQGAALVDRERHAADDAAREAGELVHRLLARLSDRDRLVLTLLHLEGLSVAEIGEATGWSQSLVKVQAHRARARLKKLMEAES